MIYCEHVVLYLIPNQLNIDVMLGCCRFSRYWVVKVTSLFDMLLARTDNMFFLEDPSF